MVYSSIYQEYISKDDDIIYKSDTTKNHDDWKNNTCICLRISVESLKNNLYAFSTINY